jgi:ZIP family zinc transporter
MIQLLNTIIHFILQASGQDDDVLEKGMDEMVTRNAIEEQNPQQEERFRDENLELGKNADTKTERLSDDEISEVDKPILFKTGVATAFAIALHNFPEGLVTFVSYVSEPAVGLALAVGIGIHNIPEGLCVAMPIYYATGSRWKGFFWGTLSGFSEPFGALIGWVVIGHSFSGNTYGIMFGLVAGVMVYICLDELLPTAYKYNTKGSIVNWSCIFGMFLIALSLVLFSL